ncbi:glycosyltransferase [Chitinophaga arvensicola]|uniref:Glycosyltransferase involved in cell wall bisynthesis n=1 Tax=Chitinophaga arvensicola TaxID=29529 RepID=A0A1I0S8X1_9BACT|nr:glycosyltransferase [Chitinophaga arvensicola]SEW52477.1 Glycosyltransferase involved in cell wall bisynthesis [Chitinophaga arvensicola]
MNKATVTKKIRIGFFFDGGEGGGVVEYIHLLLNNINRNEFQVTGFFLGNGKSHDTLKTAFDETVILTPRRLVNFGKTGTRVQKMRSNLIKIFTVAQGIKSLAAAIKKYRIDIIDVNYFPHHIIAGAACRLTGVPCVWHWHGATRPSGLRARLVAFGSRFFCNTIVPISFFVEDSLPPVAKRRSQVVYNGVAVGDISGAGISGHLRQLAGVNGNTRLIAILGTITPLKGHAFFIKAADIVLEQFPDTRFLIIGKESPAQERRIAFEAQLKKDVAELKRESKILFLGQVPNASRYLADCAIICTPSIPYRNFLGEGFGLAAAEAMAAGVPVIATNVGSFPEIIDNGKTGVLTAPADAVALADAILGLLKNESHRSALGSAAKEHIAANFDVRFTSAKMEVIYKHLI